MRFGIRAYIIFCFALILSAVPCRLQAEAGVTVDDIRYISGEGRTRISIELSGPVEHKELRLSKPERLCIDLPGGVLGKGITRTINVKDGVLKSLRAGQFNPETARVVLDFEGEGKVEKFEVSITSSPYRLLIDVFHKGHSPRSSVQKIVIDAGHGGHDPGAVGKRGLKEKDVTLAIALNLKKMLEESKKCEVFLTRSSDVYISLDKRTEIANKRDADLFISIHANANPNRDVSGIETYLLNWTDNEEAMKVAARENAISVRKMKEARNEVGLILASLELQSKRDESLKLAHSVQGSVVTGLDSYYNAVVDLGVKQALFYVLVGAKMPSVLVEVSFISNSSEEKLLGKNSYREKLAEGIAAGIEKYIAQTPPVQKFASK
ncbi:MAG: N-acetylmuramoyl-L-alanine amidase [Thermodesulfovibrionales bacterium]|nr:N-acetylmuramoyl-L-alanine amidase [Thermodesulfovibrionales bacterium]